MNGLKPIAPLYLSNRKIYVYNIVCSLVINLVPKLSHI